MQTYYVLDAALLEAQEKANRRGYPFDVLSEAGSDTYVITPTHQRDSFVTGDWMVLIQGDIAPTTDAEE